MIREIKYKAFKKKTPSRGMYAIEAIDFINKKVQLRHSFHSSFWVPFHSVEVIQYTGLKDKNGVEIYEGDIVRDFYGKVLQISWANEWGRYMLSKDGEWCQYYLNDFHKNTIDRMAESMEVIGNIYENPELLQKNKEIKGVSEKKMKDKKRWRTKGFFESGATLIRDGGTDRTLEEVKHLLTIPELKQIKVTKNDIVEQD